MEKSWKFWKIASLKLYDVEMVVLFFLLSQEDVVDQPQFHVEKAELVVHWLVTTRQRNMLMKCYQYATISTGWSPRIEIMSDQY